VRFLAYTFAEASVDESLRMTNEGLWLFYVHFVIFFFPLMKKETKKSRLQFQLLKTQQPVFIVRMAITSLGHAPLPHAKPCFGFATT